MVLPRTSDMMLKLALAFTATVLSTLTLVGAHGYVQELKLGSTSYTGYLPYSDPYYDPPIPRIIRKVPGNGTRQYVFHSGT